MSNNKKNVNFELAIKNTNISAADLSKKNGTNTMEDAKADEAVTPS